MQESRDQMPQRYDFPHSCIGGVITTEEEVLVPANDDVLKVGWNGICGVLAKIML